MAEKEGVTKNHAVFIIVGIIAMLIFAGAYVYYQYKKDLSDRKTSQQPSQPATPPSQNTETPNTRPSNPPPPSNPSQPTTPPAVKPVTESDIKTLLTSIGANELHNPPLSSNTPKIEVIVDNQPFAAEVKKGVIIVTKGEFTEEDLRIISTASEVHQMIQSSSYITTSFKMGGSSVVVVASKTALFTKGYLGLYKKVTGEEAPA